MFSGMSRVLAIWAKVISPQILRINTSRNFSGIFFMDWSMTCAISFCSIVLSNQQVSDWSLTISSRAVRRSFFRARSIARRRIVAYTRGRSGVLPSFLSADSVIASCNKSSASSSQRVWVRANNSNRGPYLPNQSVQSVGLLFNI